MCSKIIQPLPFTATNPTVATLFDVIWRSRMSVHADQSRLEWPPVPILFRIICPLAVIRRIPSIVILAVQRFPRWFFSHILQEIYEGMAPTLANENATASVRLILKVLRIVTPSYHVGPAYVGAGSIAATVVSMIEHPLTLKAS